VLATLDVIQQTAHKHVQGPSYLQRHRQALRQLRYVSDKISDLASHPILLLKFFYLQFRAATLKGRACHNDMFIFSQQCTNGNGTSGSAKGSQCGSVLKCETRLTADQSGHDCQILKKKEFQTKLRPIFPPPREKGWFKMHREALWSILEAIKPTEH